MVVHMVNIEIYLRGKQDMGIKAGDELFHVTDVRIGWSNRIKSWEKVVVERTTKTLIFIEGSKFEDVKFRRKDFGFDLREINEENVQKAKESNRLLKQAHLRADFSNYKWGEVELEKLLRIEGILNE